MQWNVIITQDCIGPKGNPVRRGVVIEDVAEPVAAGIISAGRGLIAESESGKAFAAQFKAEQAKPKSKE